MNNTNDTSVMTLLKSNGNIVDELRLVLLEIVVLLCGKIDINLSLEKLYN